MTDKVSVTSTGDGAFQITIPLTISVQIGAIGAAPPAPLAHPASDTKTPEVVNDAEAGLQQLVATARANEDRPYYQEAADTQARTSYYTGIDMTAAASKTKLYDDLNALLSSTHIRPLSYQPATHLYPWVDRQQDFSIRSLYTGQVFDLQELLTEDFRREQELARRTAALEKRRATESFSQESFENHLDALEAQFAYNCEHVVPQSWFSKRSPMRGDLHHLFACEVRCNSFRGNIPFFDFPDDNEAVMSGCGKKEDNRFEPVQGKGAAARGTLYFLLRYQREIDDSSREMTPDRIKTLIGWAKKEPVTLWEKHRNAAIFESQGNRNPLIDFPELVDRIDFARGLG